MKMDLITQEENHLRCLGPEDAITYCDAKVWEWEDRVSNSYGSERNYAIRMADFYFQETGGVDTFFS